MNGRGQGWKQTDEPTRRLLQLDSVFDLDTLLLLINIYDLGTPGAHVDLTSLFAGLDFDAFLYWLAHRSPPTATHHPPAVAHYPNPTSLIPDTHARTAALTPP